MELPQNYDHQAREKHWQQHWLQSGVYAWKDDLPRAQTYVIDTPPPTVSGLLHMGHVFSYTQADFIARYKRMRGMDVFYPMGFDDNGLPTERLVEKSLKKRAVDMSREAFIVECIKVSEEARQEFRRLFQSTALSVDWAQEYHTISDHSRRLSQMSFLDLYAKGEVYRKLQPMLWDPVDQTAIAQAEVEDKEMASTFNDILFEIVEGSPHLSEVGPHPTPLPEGEGAVKPSPLGRGLGEGRLRKTPSTPHTLTAERVLANARRLRKDATNAEQLLWSILRNRQIGGIIFRRQHPVEPYIVDFFAHDAGLIIELDGGQHNAVENQKRDAARTTHLESLGHRVLRFWNNEVMENIEGVVMNILEALAPTLSRGEREFITIGTTRPEMIPACVAIFYHPDDERYRHLAGKFALTPLFGVRVPILADESVEPEKGSGIMMCCTFGDEKDIEKWRKHGLPTVLILNKYGKLDFSSLRDAAPPSPSLRGANGDEAIHPPEFVAPKDGLPRYARNDEALNALQNLKVSNPDPKHPGARQKILEMLRDSGDLIESRPITHAVKCAERSGAALEILPTYQWFVKILDKKDTLKEKAAEAAWHPEWMKIRMDQWIDGLNWDWCISRQRYFGVPFPVWYVYPGRIVDDSELHQEGEILSRCGGVPRRYNRHLGKTICAPVENLPINPLVSPPHFLFPADHYDVMGLGSDGPKPNVWIVVNKQNPEECYLVEPEADVMDTWATSSISPQLSSHGIRSAPPSLTVPLKGEGIQNSPGAPSNPLSLEGEGRGEGGPYVPDPARHAKLFPADLRPQAHEIIRTWAFYTLVKSYLHEGVTPWKNLMISGWCLAADKTKMSKSKGNVITPVELIEEKGADAVRYWASTSRLGADTAFSEDALKIGRKLTTKLWNASKFAAGLMSALAVPPSTAESDIAAGIITETLDHWIITRLRRAIDKATTAFDAYEYADARAAAEDFFWNDFCDNYLELVKSRAYGNDTTGGQQSALTAIHHCLNGILKLFAPFVPHIAEELFSALFPAEYAAAGSIHARGIWPRSEAYPCNDAAEAAGMTCVLLLNSIRKAKSENNRSLKYPLSSLAIASYGHPASDMLKATGNDLRSASNAMLEIKWTEIRNQDAGIRTEDGAYALYPVFAETSDVA